jgi:subtilisin family serine protease
MAAPIQFDPALKQLLLRRTGSPLGEALPADAEAELVPVVARLRDPRREVAGLRIVARAGDVVTARVALGQIVSVRRDPDVLSLKASRTYAPSLVHSVPEIHATAPELARAVPPAGVTGAGTVIAFLDWGFDFVHSNFRTGTGGTRLLWLWDQRGGRLARSPEPFGEGREWSRADVDAALAQPDPYTALGYDPVSADVTGFGAHGTHVADIAAGNGAAPGSSRGVAPGADLVFVHLKGEDTAPEDNLGDSVRLIEAARYVLDRTGDRPLVINCSLGTTGGPHDATPLVVRAFDALLEERPGFVVVMSCGNYGDADLHSHGRVTQGGDHDLRWRVVEGDEDAELEVWYSGADIFAATLHDPNGALVASAALGEDAVARSGSRVTASLFHRSHDPLNGDNHVDAFVWPGAPAGTWTLRLRGVTVHNGSFDAYIERAPARRQSRFVTADATAAGTTGSICNGFGPIAVAAYDARDPLRRSVPSSSRGPSRDGRAKPDVSAPGWRIRAARSSRPGPDGTRLLDRTTIMSGTSMAAPHASGVAALVLEAATGQPAGHEVKRILVATARGSPPSDEAEKLRYGAGRIDAAAAVALARSAARPSEAALPAPALAAPLEGVDVEPEPALQAVAVAVAEPPLPEPVELAELLAQELVPAGDRALRRRDADGTPVYDAAQPLVFGPTGQRYSLTAERLNYHAANFVFNTAYETGFDVPVQPTLSRTAAEGLSYHSLASTFSALAGTGAESLRDYLERFFEIVAGPGSEAAPSVRAGDLLLRAPGPGMPLGHLSIVADASLRPLDGPVFAARDAAEGSGVLAISAGPELASTSSRFGRLLVSADGRVPPDRMLLRFRNDAVDVGRGVRSAVEAEAAELLAAGDAHVADGAEMAADEAELAEDYQPAGGRRYAPAAGRFRCAPDPALVAPAGELPVRTVDPDAATAAALGALGVDAAGIASFAAHGGTAALRPIAERFGPPALTELLRRLRYDPGALVTPPHTHGRGLRRLGVAHAAGLLAPRALLAVPGHFRELARRAPTEVEAYALETVGWLLAGSLRDEIQAATGHRWWLPPAPDWARPFGDPLPQLSADVARLVVGSFLIDTTLDFATFQQAFRSWSAGPAGSAWRSETGGQAGAAAAGRPFSPDVLNGGIPAALDVGPERAAFDEAWARRLAQLDADPATPPLSDASTDALHQCANASLPHGRTAAASLGGLELVFDFPIHEPGHGPGPRVVFHSVNVLSAIRPTCEALFGAAHALGWNDLLFECAGATCFRGIKLPASRAHPNRHREAARRLSNHSYGLALDFNTFENGQNSRGSMDPRVVALFEAFHFRWGRCFPVPDPMHFEYCGRAC